MKIVETLADSLLTMFAPRKTATAAVQCGEVHAAGLCSGCPPSGRVAYVRQCTSCGGQVVCDCVPVAGYCCS